ncbi:MAG: hypothetical protein ABSF64_10290 [Bryobacteraceae bacterium]|jgi:hypothetical protein
MLNHSMIVSESPHFHPPASATPPITLQGFVRKSAANGDSASQGRILSKRLSCKTCLGKCCIGRCRF